MSFLVTSFVIPGTSEWEMVMCAAPNSWKHSKLQVSSVTYTSNYADLQWD